MAILVIAIEIPWNLGFYRSGEQENPIDGHAIFFSTKGPVYFSLKTSAIFCCTHIVLRKKNIFVEVKGLVTALKRSMKCRQVEEI